MSELLEERDRVLREIAARHDDRSLETYWLVLQVLDFVIERNGMGRKHVSCKEMADGLREFALEFFGCMAHVVLNDLGLFRSEDLGDCIFELINADLLQKTADDKLSDFDGVCGYDRESFEKSYAELIAALDIMPRAA